MMIYEDRSSLAGTPCMAQCRPSDYSPEILYIVANAGRKIKGMTHEKRGPKKSGPRHGANKTELTNRG
jgi:hypothetical protein